MSRLKNIVVNSLRFKLAVVGVLVVFSEELGLPISEESILALVGLLIAWIVGDSYRKTE